MSFIDDMLYFFFDSFAKRFLSGDISFIPPLFLTFILFFLLHAVSRKLGGLILLDITSIVVIRLNYQERFCFTQKYRNLIY